MQQPGQPEQIGGGTQQQTSQQMMLCPVRFVYETQILVQPGDQIQPNQTIFLNQQNLPPWIQNRTVPNQVIYVQQLPSNNYLPAIQSMDQNQMYIQHNFTNYPQIMPNTIMPQNTQDHIRPTMQMANVMPHIIQNQHSNMVSNVTNLPNERMIAQPLTNYNHMASNTGTMQNQTQNIINVGVNNERQIVANIQTTPQVFNQSPNTFQKPQDLQAVRHQSPIQRPYEAQMLQHQANVRSQNPPQVMAVNPMQNISNVPQRTVNITNAINAGVGNILQPNNPIKTVTQTNSAPQSTNTYPTPNIVQGSPISSVNNTIVAQPGMLSNKVVMPNIMNKTTSIQTVLINSSPKNHGTSYRPPYRPIQPRPQTYANTANFLPVTTQVNQIHNQIQNISNVREMAPKQSNYGNNSQYLVPNYGKDNNSNVQNNRKRKSESPDEFNKKVIISSVPAVNDTKISIKVENDLNSNKPNQTNEIGINTSPLHKPLQKRIPQTSIVNTETKNMASTDITNLIKTVQSLPDLGTEIKTEGTIQDIIKEKLVRNTVYTQARGRQHSDKLLDNNIIVSIKNETKPNIKDETFSKALCDSKGEKQELLLTNVCDMQESSDNKMITNQEQPPTDVIETLKTENVIKETKIEETNIKQENEFRSNLENIQSDTTERKNKVLVFDDMKGKEICVIDGNVRKETRDNFLLTHVLDGYVIQESNIAFPIRRPLKEKTTTNISSATDQPTQDQKLDVTSEKHKDDPIKDNSKIFNISHLNLSDFKHNEVDMKISEEIVNDKDNPFRDVTHEAVKKWTVEELSSHLSKYDWDETILVLREHEIDGDALFLVSKPQLVTIGVNEDHAGIICDFVKS